MAILVQRDFTVATGDVAEFETMSREGVWPAFLRYGAVMAAFVSWQFGERSGLLATHTMYADFDHWSATRTRGAYSRDEAMRAEVAPFLARARGRGEVVEGTRARAVELFDVPGAAVPVHRSAGSPVPDPPPTFGRGSVVAEVRDESRDDDASRRRETWLWLSGHGARVVACGRSLEEPGVVVTWIAYRSLDDWRALSAGPVLPAGARVVSGRVGTVATVFGTPV